MAEEKQIQEHRYVCMSCLERFNLCQLGLMFTINKFQKALSASDRTSHPLFYKEMSIFQIVFKYFKTLK